MLVNNFLYFLIYLDWTKKKSEIKTEHGMANKDDDINNDFSDTSVLVKKRSKLKKPPLYKVLLLNDDFTPMEFVVHVLEKFFAIGHEKAVQIMLTVHKKGIAVVGVYSHDIAETKVTQVMDYSRKNQHPLQCTMEKE